MDSMKLVPYIENSRLSDFALSCAKALSPLSKASGRAEAAQLRRSMKQLEKCHGILQRRYESPVNIPAACEWLLDNRYMIQQEYPDSFARLSRAQDQRSCRGRLNNPQSSCRIHNGSR